jgi:F-type H+-transporting ATPase subunit a
MGEESTWFDLFPGLHNLTEFASQYLGRTKGLDQFPTGFTMTHVYSVALVLLFVTIGSLVFSAKMAKGGRDAIVPPRKFNLRNLFEMFTDAILGIAEGVMGHHNARRFLPLIGTLAFFIFFSNALALLPGFAPPTATLKTNVALALTVFLVTHAMGVKEHGLSYFKHFLGPVIWLAPLMVLIEIVSHIARPVSLSLRLLGNIAADHKVAAVFFGLVPLLVPMPFLILGTIVVIVQTVVFCLLSMVYIQGAVAHEHDENGHGHEAHAH